MIMTGNLDQCQSVLTLLPTDHVNNSCTPHIGLGLPSSIQPSTTNIVLPLPCRQWKKVETMFSRCFSIYGLTGKGFETTARDCLGHYGITRTLTSFSGKLYDVFRRDGMHYND